MKWINTVGIICSLIVILIGTLNRDTDKIWFGCMLFIANFLLRGWS